MKKRFVEKFLRGRWFSKANSILADRSRFSIVLGMLPRYLGREGLQQCRQDLELLGDYLRDVYQGKYTAYSRRALTLAVAALVYVVSPLDLVPDFVPAGLLDDATIIAWAIAQLTAELKRYRLFVDEKRL